MHVQENVISGKCTFRKMYVVSDKCTFEEMCTWDNTVWAKFFLKICSFWKVFFGDVKDPEKDVKDPQKMNLASIDAYLLKAHKS